MAADGCRRVVLLPVVLSSLWPCIMVSAQSLASVEVFFKDRRVVPTLLQGEVIEGSWADDPQRDGDPRGAELRPGSVEGNLRVVQDDSVNLQDQSEANEPWIGVVPVQIGESDASNGNQESFAAAVVNKMKRALVLGASALLILAFNQNTLREMDLSQVLSKPVVVIQTSENVTKLLGALLRGLRATAKITYRTLVQENLGATLTLWSSCGRSRGGLYGEWQGVICTGESNSQVQVGLPEPDGPKKTPLFLEAPLGGSHAFNLLSKIMCFAVTLLPHFALTEVPAAAVGHSAPGGHNPVHGSHRPGALAVSRPGGRRQPGAASKAGRLEEAGSPKDKEVPPAAATTGRRPGNGDGGLCRVPGAVLQQPVPAGAALPARVPQGLRGHLAAPAAHLPTVQAQHPG
ncbi:uncharacterized protein rnf215 isoform X1 [Paramormyrops kingsleyae]|uniref:uncharacterized protein rnf215 isoform X1 n=1 Tax=Paramormyrops kingsleyae TaxID=1676925 RepID=UPI003B9727D0